MRKGNIRKVKLALFVVAMGGLAFLWFFDLVRGHGGMQKSVFFINHNDWAMDFYNTVAYSVGLTPYTWGARAAHNYLPLNYLLLYPFTFLYNFAEGSAGAARSTQMMANMGVLYYVFSYLCLFWSLDRGFSKDTKSITRVTVLLALLVSGASLYSIDRGNQVILAAAFIFVFLMTYDSSIPAYRYLGGVSLAVAAVMKLFPAVLGILLLYKKQWREAFFAAFSGVVLAIAPFGMLEGGWRQFWFHIEKYIECLKIHVHVYSEGDFGISAPLIFGDFRIPGIVGYVLLLVTLLCAWALKRKWKLFLVLILAIELASGEQGYYTFLYLMLPIVLFLDEREACASDFLWLAGFILIFQPYQYSWADGIIKNKTVINTVSCLMWLILVGEAICCTIPVLRTFPEQIKKSSRR